MNIHELGGGLPEPVHSGSRKINPPHFRGTEAGASRGVSAGGAKATGHARDPEVIRLVQSMNQSPDVRLDKVAEIQQRLRAGEFLTRQTAEQTADAILKQ